jgi:hypothetical protein
MLMAGSSPLRVGARLLRPFAFSFFSLFAAGCGGGGSHVLGTPPAGTPILVSAAKEAAPGTPLILRGKMVER